MRWRTTCTIDDFYLEQLNGLAVLLLSAQLSHLDEDRPWVTGILGLKAGRQFPALISLLRRITQVAVVKNKIQTLRTASLFSAHH